MEKLLHVIYEIKLFVYDDASLFLSANIELNICLTLVLCNSCVLLLPKESQTSTNDDNPECLSLSVKDRQQTLIPSLSPRVCACLILMMMLKLNPHQIYLTSQSFRHFRCAFVRLYVFIYVYLYTERFTQMFVINRIPSNLATDAMFKRKLLI